MVGEIKGIEKCIYNFRIDDFIGDFWSFFVVKNSGEVIDMFFVWVKDGVFCILMVVILRGGLFYVVLRNN